MPLLALRTHVAQVVFAYAGDERHDFGNRLAVLLELRAFSPGDGFDVTVASHTIGMTDKGPRVRFEPDTVFAEPSAKFGSLGEMKGVIFSDSLWPNSPQPAVDGEPSQPSTAEERYAREAEISALVVAKPARCMGRWRR